MSGLGAELGRDGETLEPAHEETVGVCVGEAAVDPCAAAVDRPLTEVAWSVVVAGFP